MPSIAVQTSTPTFLGNRATGAASAASGGGLTNASRAPGGAMMRSLARYAAAASYMCAGSVRYARAPSHIPSASGRTGTSADRITSRSQKTPATTQYKAGRDSTSAAASLSRPDNSISGGSDAAASVGARKPAGPLQELDEREHRRRELAAAQVHDVPVAADRKAAHVELDQAAPGQL